MTKKGKGLLTGQASSQASLMKGSAVTRSYLNGNLTAKRVIVPSTDINTKTDIHPLNPRNQEALSIEAVRDILPSIKENGVNQEGVAVRCLSSGKLLLLDASRRRFCCAHSNVDLPLWEIQGDITDEQILAIINDSQEVKRWSYPEHAQYLLRIAERKSLDVDAMKIEDLAEELSIGRESLRKRLAANKVSKDILAVFVDYEGIPNSYYSSLTKIQNQLSRANKNIKDTMESFVQKLRGIELGTTVSDKQAATLKGLEEFVEHLLKKQPKPEWSTRELCQFTDKKAYARTKISPDGKTMKIELSRVGVEKMREIERLTRQILNS